MSQSLLFRSAVWFSVLNPILNVSLIYVAIPSIQVCCLIRSKNLNINFVSTGSRNPFYSGLLFDSTQTWSGRYICKWVAIPSIQVCCLIQDNELGLSCKKLIKSQSLLFRSAVWFLNPIITTIDQSIGSQSLLFRSAVWFTNDRLYRNIGKWSRNPFYSGLLFDSKK